MSERTSTDRAETVRRLFDELVEVGPDERAERLAALDDAALRREVASLLDAADWSAAQFEVLDELHVLLAPPASGSDPHHLVGQRIRQYEIDAYLGGGGMGVVYRAHDTKLDRPVALKFLPPHLSISAEAKARFVREARAASALDHPHIATIYEIGETKNGQLFIAMAYYAGETLKAKIARGPLPIEEAVGYAIQIADGLSKAHAEGIIHRDVKPANVMVTEDGYVKLLDFGLAKLGEVNLTQTGRVLGTAAYMSPEQARGNAVDHRTDVWALGVVLYEMVTGARPFRGTTAGAVIYGIRNDEPDPPHEHRPDLPDDLKAIIHRCLRKDPDERYARAEELVTHLRRVHPGSDSTWAGSWTEQFRATRFPISRRRVSVGVAGLLVVLLVLWAALPGRGVLVQHSAPSSASGDIRSLAVLPLANLSGDADEEYFAAGMTEALINRLGQMGNLTVISRTSVLQYRGTQTPVREIAKELNVDAVVEGSVAHAGETVRVTTQLVDASTDRQIWAASYEEKLRDVLQLQSQIARAVAREIQITVTPEQEDRLFRSRTVNPAAYEAYLKGMYHVNKFTPAGFERGMAYFRTAIEKDPGDPLPYAGLALGYSLIGHNSPNPPPDAFKRAKAAAREALNRDETRAEAHEALAEIALYKDWNLSEAAEAFKRVLSLNPNLAAAHAHYGWYLDAVGRGNDGVSHMMRAQELDPLAPIYTAWLGWLYVESGQYDNAIQEAQKALELDSDFPWGLYVLGLAHQHVGRYEEAIAAHKRLAETAPPLRWGLGHTYGVAGQRDRARAIADELRETPTPMQMWGLALIEVSLGNEDRAIQWLESAYEARFNWMPWIDRTEAFEALYDDPRFQQLVRRIKGTTA